MRLLFVNHLHPDTGLIGAVRLQRFAEELSKRGHHVLLLCASHDGAWDTLETFVKRIGEHDWSVPLLLSVRDDGLTRPHAQSRRIPPLVRRARTAFRLAVRGGPFWQWRRAARHFLEPINQLFSPHLSYATFGNLDALALAREYARRFGIPWVMDIKDPASTFIPNLLASLLMRPYRDAAAVTLNADFQRTRNGCWADASSFVVYSGVDVPRPTDQKFDPARAAMVGSTYGDESTEVLLRGFRDWRTQHHPMANLHYFGLDGERVAEIARRLGLADALILEGQIPRLALLERCTQMAALLYCAEPRRTFHHKLLELAAVGRPVITSPVESDEALALCARYGVGYTGADSGFAVCAALEAASRTSGKLMEDLQREAAWAAVAGRLEEIFRAVLGGDTWIGQRR